MHSDTDTQASEIEEIKNTQRLAKLDECFDRYGAYDEISWPDYAKKLQQDQEEFEAMSRAPAAALEPLQAQCARNQDAPAVQGEPIPAGFALIKLDSRTGEPLVTSEMKAKHIGEYWWGEEAPYYDEHGDLHDYVARHAVPWSLCKEIYKNMASTAMLSAQPADQQPAPDVAGLVEALETACEYLPIGSRELELARTALAAHRKQGGK